MMDHTRNRLTSAWVCLVVAATGAAAFGQEKQPAAEEAFKQLARYTDGDSQQPLRTIEMLAGRATNDAARRREVADRLAAILAEAKTSQAAKVFICRVLPLVASDAHVPVLVKVLDDAETTEMARRALAAIPGEASGKVLREALGTVKGPVLLGVINSLGDRRDAEAVAGLSRLVYGTKRDIANAAVRALGKIGTPEAAAVLDRALRMSNVLAGLEALLDAQLRCAERLAAEGDRATATAIYRRLSRSKGPVRWRLAGLTGLVGTAGDDAAEAAEAVVAAMASKEPRLRGTALRLARRLRGPKVTAALLKQLDTLEPASQAVLIDVLGDRGDQAAAAAVAKRISAQDEAVRVAAVRAMAKLGEASAVATLARLSATGRGAVRQAARASLARLTGPGVDRELLAAAVKGETAVRVEAIRALSARQTTGAGQTLIKLAADPEEPIRVAALEALAPVGGPGEYTKLLDLIVSPPSPSTAATIQAAEKAALAIGGRAGDEGGRNQRLLAALKRAPAKSKPPLLRLMSLCRASEVLRAVRESIRHKDREVADAAVRALANWSTVAAADHLLELAQNSQNAVHRTLALRGYLRLARAAEAGERLKMIRAVKEIAATAPAKLLLLSGLADVPDAGALELTMSFLDDGEVRAEAALAALKVGKALLAADRPAVRAAMEKLQAKAPDADVLKQAKAIHAEALKPQRRRGAGGSQAGLAPDKARSDAAKKDIAKRAPKGYRLACYLDCGPDDADGLKGGATLRFLGGSKYSWSGADRVSVRHGTVCFAGQEVGFEAVGLNPKRSYQVGFSWWDYDHDTRRQSVWVSAGKPRRAMRLLGATKLPSYASGGNKAAEKTLPIPRNLSVFGKVRTTFRNEASPNVVVSEIWLWESEAESAAPAPMPAQSSADASPPAVAARGPAGKRAARKRAKDAPRATEPVAFKPGKKALKRVLIVTGIDYPGHKWRLTTPVLAAGLDKDARLAIDVVETPDFLASKKLNDYDAAVLHFMNWRTPDPGKAARENLRKFVAGGKGIVLVHFACGAFQGWKEFAKLAGRAWNPKLRGHDPRGAFRVNIVDADHPVTKGMKSFETADELYTCLDGNAPIHVLASSTSKVDKKDYPMAFVLTYGKGRVFHCPLGHDVKAFEAPGVLELFRRGTAWAARLEPVAPRKKPKQ